MAMTVGIISLCPLLQTRNTNEGFMMKNRDIYQKDPASRKLINQGVASVNDEQDSDALAVLRYELETFVCDGQYEAGMSDILATYLKNVDQLEQPAAWVSGFYGSGKSHLVKMLRALWVDTSFDDGASARGIANLPQGIRDQLKELSTQAKRHGGLHAVSGTLGAGASGSVRLALLRLILSLQACQNSILLRALSCGSSKKISTSKYVPMLKITVLTGMKNLTTFTLLKPCMMH